MALMIPLSDNERCPKWKMYFSKKTNVLLKLLIAIDKCICPNCKMYLTQFLNVFVQITKCICPNNQMYLSKWEITDLQAKRTLMISNEERWTAKD